jgi:hypothetical protein
MTKMIATACATACLWTSAAFCQTDSSAYCRSAALREGATDAEIAAVWQRCKKGDTIAISSGAQDAASQIGRLCDFTKPVVNAGSQTICVLGSERGVR